MQVETKEKELATKTREFQEISQKTLNIKQEFRHEIKELKLIIDEKERKSEEFQRQLQLEFENRENELEQKCKDLQELLQMKEEELEMRIKSSKKEG